MLDLNQFASPYNQSLYKGIPIQFLAEVKQVLKDNGIHYRVKYRGPRAGLDNRTRDQRQADCVRRFATSFAVYPKY